ncbi:hypothetical protein DNTS_020402, partial [Danionella cerebrum]
MEGAAFVETNHKDGWVPSALGAVLDNLVLHVEVADLHEWTVNILDMKTTDHPDIRCKTFLCWSQSFYFSLIINNKLPLAAAYEENPEQTCWQKRPKGTSHEALNALRDDSLSKSKSKCVLKPKCSRQEPHNGLNDARLLLLILISTSGRNCLLLP